MPRVVASISRILTPGASSILTAAEKPSDTFQSLLLVDYWLFEKWEYRPPPLVQQPRCLHAPIIIDIPRRSPLHLSFPSPPPSSTYSRGPLLFSYLLSLRNLSIPPRVYQPYIPLNDPSTHYYQPTLFHTRESSTSPTFTVVPSFAHLSLKKKGLLEQESNTGT